MDESGQKATNTALAEHFKRIRGARGFEQLRQDMKDAGYDIGMGTLQRLDRGETGVRLASLKKFAAYDGKEPEDLLRGPEEESPFVPVMRVDVAFSAGAGSEPHIEEEQGALQFRADFLRSCGVSSKRAAVVNVKGMSMYPTLSDGAVLLISRADTEPRHNCIYAFRHGVELKVKRFVKDSGRWIARSDNDDKSVPEHRDIVFSENDQPAIIGRAIWMGAKL